MTTAQTITDFLKWLITYAVTNGFLHFVAVVLIVSTITGITTLVKFPYKFEKTIKTVVSKKPEDE